MFELDRKCVCLSWNSKALKVLQASQSLQPSYPLQIIGFDPDAGLQHDDWCSIVCISSCSHDLYIQNLFDLQHAFCAKSYSLGASWFLLTKIFTKKLQTPVLVYKWCHLQYLVRQPSFLLATPLPSKKSCNSLEKLMWHEFSLIQAT